MAYALTFQEFLNESDKTGKDLVLKDLRVGLPAAIEKHKGSFQKGFITAINGDMISVDADSVSGNYKYGDKSLTLPTYGTPFTDIDGKKHELS